MKKRIWDIALAALLAVAFFLSACGGGADTGTQDGTGNAAEIEFWSTYSTEKILRNVDSEAYSDVKLPAAVKITAVKNEYENAQILMTAGADGVAFYDVSLSDLTLTGAGTKYSADNVGLFNQKYIEIAELWNSARKLPKGLYPDALLPFEAAKEHKENFITPNTNQGLWFQFYIPKSQTAGKYTGAFTITYDGASKNIPVELNVLDFQLPDERTAKNIFSTGRSLEFAELNSTPEMKRKYQDVLLEFRLNPNIYVEDIGNNDEGYRYYADVCYDYFTDVRTTNLSVPFAATTGGINTEITKAYIIAIAEKGFKEGVDMLSIAYMNIGTIDEPNGFTAAENLVKPVMTQFYNTINAAADQIELNISAGKYGNPTEYPGFTGQLGVDAAASARAIKHVTTSYPYAKIQADVENNNGVWCPLFSEYDSPEARELYAQYDERWWYGCLYPMAPHPTYHIDDIGSSPRLVGWMQADWDITGNLFWSVSSYFAAGGETGDGTDGEGKPRADYYSTPASRFAPGDGALFYPGRPYGIYGPVVTTRLQYIRDGYEEYELIKILKAKYAQIGGAGAAEEVLQTIFGTLYSGTKLFAAGEAMERARLSMLNLLMLAENGVAVTGAVKTAAQTEFSLLAADGVTLKANGAALTSTGTQGAYKRYTANIPAADQFLTLEVKTAGGDITLVLYLGGALTVYDAQAVKDNLTFYNSAGSASVTSTTVFGGTVSAVKMDFNLLMGGGNRIARLDGALTGSIGAQSSKLSFELYNNESSGLKYEIRFKFAGSLNMQTLASGTLPSKKAEAVTIAPLQTVDWTALGAVERIDFVLIGSGVMQMPATVYVKALTLVQA
ncbi:MAG: DUF4091 domain-containing protein [Firmicutes bacterium]|nr:DUF4091 domain-containing protein [Bacillota bacterium]